MAIDSQAKRRSVQGYGAGICYPLPDGTVSANDRRRVAWLYSFTDDGGGGPIAVILGGIARLYRGRC